MLPAYWRPISTMVDREFSATTAYLQLKSIAAPVGSGDKPAHT
jgi:hypothetical protein